MTLASLDKISSIYVIEQDIMQNMYIQWKLRVSSIVYFAFHVDTIVAAAAFVVSFFLSRSSCFVPVMF